MEHIRPLSVRCNRFLASRTRGSSACARAVRVVGPCGTALTILAVSLLNGACSPRPAERVRRIQSIPREQASPKRLRRYLGDSDPSVRAAAIGALHLGEGSQPVEIV